MMENVKGHWKELSMDKSQDSLNKINNDSNVEQVKNPSAMQETWVQSLGWEDPLEEDMITHSSILAWRTPMDKGAWWATVHGLQKGRQD